MNAILDRESAIFGIQIFQRSTEAQGSLSSPWPVSCEQFGGTSDTCNGILPRGLLQGCESATGPGGCQACPSVVSWFQTMRCPAEVQSMRQADERRGDLFATVQFPTLSVTSTGRSEV